MISPDEASDPAPRLIPFATLFYGALALVALGWNAWAGTPWAFVDASAQAEGVRFARDAALGIGAAAGTIALSHGLTHHTAWGRRLATELASVIGRLGRGEALWLGLVSGFAEEAFFRGALQPRVGWLAASLIFGLVHVPPNRALLPWTGFAVVAGGMLGGLYLMTGNLLAPILAHAGINAVNLRLLGTWVPRDPRVDPGR